MEWSERIPLLVAIIRKDLRAAKWWWVAAIILAAVGFLLTMPLAISLANLRGLYPGYSVQFTWYDSSLRGYYGLTALLTSVALGAAFSRVYTGEVHRGTIRSIILYPVDVEDVILAKLGSSVAIAFLASFPIFLGFMLPLFLVGAFPAGDFLAIYFMSLLMGLVALATGVFLSVVVAHYTGQMAVSPSTMGSLFLLFAALLSQQVVSTLGNYFLSLLHAPGTWPTPAETAAVEGFARAISVLSPQHMGARILGDLFGISSLWPDLHVVVPVFLLVVAGGHLLSRRLYLDLFIR